MGKQPPNYRSIFCSSRPLGNLKKFDFAYRFAHPMAALQAGMSKDVEKFSKGQFDYASFDAQVFGKQASEQTHEPSHFSDRECL